MGSILVINSAGRETRVALVEGGHIAEFYLERKKDKGVVGNIYKGRVVRVLPGMQAAFVDIGLEKAAFLYVSDVVYDPDFARAQFELTEGEHEDFPDVPSEFEAEAAEADNTEPVHEVSAEVELEVQELAPGELAPPPQGEPPTEAAAPSSVTAAAAELSLPASEGAAGSVTPAEHATPPPPPAAAFESTPEPEPTAEAAPEAAPEAALATSEAAPASAPEAAATSTTAEATPGLPAQPEPPPHAATALSELIPPPAPPAEAAAPAPRPEVATGERRAPREGREARDSRHRERDSKEKSKRPREDQPRREKDEKSKVRKNSRIEDLLKVGQEVVVQISKDPIGTKGARCGAGARRPGAGSP
jgi:ribonuclease G